MNNCTTKLQVIDEAEVKEFVLNLVESVINSNDPHLLIASKEPFENLFGTISYDYSGNVRRLAKADHDTLINYLYESEQVGDGPNLYGLLSHLFINEWTATYVSNSGKAWTSYWDLVTSEFDRWRYDNFEVMDDDEELTEIYFELDYMCEEICKAEDFSPYLDSIINSLD